ncbi:hypothetical protein [Bythopirellula polymerisocia]|uniref:Uncharacterized protein n=1 Tax=Bythopirellula polymerisocia TaxID=2528003 RepID=A0A5C6CZ18_9BACT|nr:hypothetical protein [Bythopirellula polymerisocia]TWU27899.1 hypothetical protein Pla144_26780 [Bythopirellula polymerisocia]
MAENSGPSLRLHFSLRNLFTVMTTVAVLCGVAALLPVALTQLVIGAIWIVAASVLFTGLFFGEGDERAFCIGATVALSSMWTGPGGRFMMGVHSIFDLLFGSLSLPQSVTLWFDLGVHVLLVLANGWLCIRARAWFQRNRMASDGANSGEKTG